MKIALLGYGKMGKAIERMARERGHEIVFVSDDCNRSVEQDKRLREADVAIEFTMPAAAVNNYAWCFRNQLPVVSGTTGWLNRWEEVITMCNESRGSFFYASNFSIGVNIFFHLNRWLAKTMSRFDGYKVFVEETHHIHKLDAPSGTAIALAEGIMEQHAKYSSWKLTGEPTREGEIPITARREGEIPGIHAVTYKSDVDEIEIYHSALSRDGFALGAVMAAEFLIGKKGVYGMEDLLHLDDNK
ncbi:4-hydroxy-tetrahydrodipicolinate reductase [uncultured Sanguibacteroides sp.]|uniref:4-hydroxy-tetrahydrodipicolinate reductase n=1 Tax=uncultured Sanguibacteroides sp. TaxID=1635151 RepID=UPI0025FAEC5C|nr:4-hydroxy-tetrahydrodipicolinate reductase [uncultured Sanguibacteroides sp.]